MNSKKSLFVSFGVLVVSVLLLLLTRTIPETQLWNGYKIVYAKSNQLSEEAIYSVLLKNGCSDVIFSGNQRLPFYSPFAPIQSQSNVFYGNSYIDRRDSFFTDSSGTYMIFYVPENQSKELSYSISELNTHPETYASTDGNSSFPWLPPSVCSVFSALLFGFSERKKYFLPCALPLVLFAFTRPFFTVCAAIDMALLAFFLTQNLWGRKDIFKVFIKSFYLSALFIAPAVFLIFSSLLSAALYVAAVSGAFSLFKIYIFFEDCVYSKTVSFVPIRKASSVKLAGKNSLFIFAFLFFSIIVMIPISAFSVDFESDFVSKSGALLPSPSKKTKSDKHLPGVDSFMDWAWITASFPYRKLYSQSEKPFYGEIVSITEYVQDGNKISSFENVIMKYNDDFILSVADSVDSLEYPAIEKMLLKQGKHAEFSYTKSGGAQTEKSAVFLLAIFAVIPLLLTIYYFMTRKKYDFGL